MKLRLDPITAKLLSILLGSAWYKMTYEPICYQHEEINGKIVEVPYLCKDLFEEGMN